MGRSGDTGVKGDETEPDRRSHLCTSMGGYCGQRGVARHDWGTAGPNIPTACTWTSSAGREDKCKNQVPPLRSQESGSASESGDEDVRHGRGKRVVEDRYGRPGFASRNGLTRSPGAACHIIRYD